MKKILILVDFSEYERKQAESDMKKWADFFQGIKGKVETVIMRGSVERCKIKNPTDFHL